jgi:hypothetical protein
MAPVLPEDLYADVEVSFDVTAKRRAALAANEILTNNLDINESAGTVLGALPRIWSFYDELVNLSGFRREALDSLLDCTKAVLHANANCATVVPDLDKIKPIDEDATRKRHLYELICRAMMAEDVLPADALKDFDGGNGFSNKASDLHILANLLMTNMDAVKKSRINVTVDELKHAQDLAVRLRGMVAQREQSPQEHAAAIDTRNRAFTLFFNCYDEVCRGLTYTRWYHHDIEQIAPSLYSYRAKLRHSDKALASSTTTPAASPAPLTPATVTENQQKVPLGAQGGSPFTD